MHGRQAERDAIVRLIADARDGSGGQVLVLRGEAGIGKSTLLRYAAELAAGRMRMLSCAGVESEVEHAFSGLHQLLRPVLDRLDALPAAQAAALRGALGVTDSAVSDLRVSAALLDLLAEAAADRPLLVTVDDLQWLDRATAAALLFAVRRLATGPIAVLLAAREPEQAPVETTDLPGLAVRGLPERDAMRLLTELGWEPPDHLRAPLLRATGGTRSP